MSAAGYLEGYYRRQFEEDRERLLYRHKGIGPAITVTASERDTYLEETSRAARRAMFWLVAIMFAGFFATVPVAISIETSDADWVTPIGFALTISAAVLIHFRILRGPNKKFEQVLVGRSPVKAALGKDEVQRLRLSQISYGQLALAPTLGLLFSFERIANPSNTLSGYWWLIPIGIAAVAGVQAFRKWRYT